MKWNDIYSKIDKHIKDSIKPYPIEEVAKDLNLTVDEVKSFASLNPELAVDKGGVFRRKKEKLTTAFAVMKVLEQASEPLTVKEITERVQAIKPDAKQGAIYAALSNLTVRDKIIRDGQGKQYKYSVFKEGASKAPDVKDLAQQLVRQVDSLQTENFGLKQRLRKVNKELEAYRKAAQALREV